MSANGRLQPGPVEKPRILLAAGGTGGHLFPAVAVAEEILRLRPGAELLFVGAGRPIEAEILDSRGFKRKMIPVEGLKGRSVWGGLKGLARLPFSLGRSLSLIRAFRPHLVLATGGYVCGPVGLAARIMGVPLALHEQNARPGLTNRWLNRLRLTRKVFLGWPGTESFFSSGTVKLAGNPIRREILEAAGRGPARAEGRTTILVAGGSQGARGLNQLALEALPRLKVEGWDFKIIHQTGVQDADLCRAAYEDGRVEAEVAPFFSDMARVYQASSFGLMRAGALTLAEITALGLPSILVPLPGAADNHQEANARTLVEAGAAFMVRQNSGGAENIYRRARELLASRALVAEMAQKARGLAVLGAGRIIAEDCLAMIGPEAGARLE